MENKYYPHLFSPLKVRGVTIRNRVVSAPHSCPFMLTPGVNGAFDYSEDGAFHFASIARGGAGIINTGHLGPDPRYLLGANRLLFDFFSPMLRWHQIPSMRRMTDLIHAHGGIASFELNHGGIRSTPIEGNEVPGPSYAELPNGNIVREIDEEEMDKICNYFADAAEIGLKGGFDMINVHAGHAWLPGQFFSPINNHRTDKYGGSIENRARFPKMIMQRIRDRIGPNVPLEMRFSGSELCKEGYTPDDAVELIKQFVGIVDIVQTTVGRLDVPESEVFTFPTQYAEHGVNVYLAKKVKEECPGIFVECIGGINEPEMAENIVKNGWADFVGMARSFIADPNWAIKAQHGHADDIRPCIRCVRCMDMNSQFCMNECTVNPRLLVFREQPNEIPFRKKKIAVIGGGPAGMQAALDLVGKGHSVILYEKKGKLGGKLEFADHIPFKADVGRFRDWQIRQVKKAEGIEVRLGTAVTPEMIKEQGFDAAVLAVGAPPLVPPIPGLRGKNVHNAIDIFGKEDTLGQKLVVIGGGAVGCEAAIHFAHLGKDVTVLEMKDDILADTVLQIEAFATRFFMNHEWDVKLKNFMDVPENPRIHTYVKTRCAEVGEGYVLAVNENGEELRFEADDVVLCAGSRPDKDLLEKFADCAEDVLTIGDALKPGSIHDATSTGYYTSLRL